MARYYATMENPPTEGASIACCKISRWRDSRLATSEPFAPKAGNASLPNISARHLIVHGRVQGVFYRDWTVETARSLALAGWVRNLPDGTVEAQLEGEPGAVRRMIAAMHEGPPHARVERIEESEIEFEELSGFARR